MNKKKLNSDKRGKVGIKKPPTKKAAKKFPTRTTKKTSTNRKEPSGAINFYIDKNQSNNTGSKSEESNEVIMLHQEKRQSSSTYPESNEILKDDYLGSNSNQPESQSQKSGCGCSGIIIGVLVVAIMYSAIRYLIDKNNFTKGSEAYAQADCEIAINSFVKITNTWRLYDIGDYAYHAQQKLIECQAFQVPADEQIFGDLSSAILLYRDFMLDYASSPLSQEASNRIQSIFTQTDADALVSEELCDKIFFFERENLIPQKNSLLPNLLSECGQTYEEVDDYYDAIRMYSKFLSEFPNHSLASRVEDALARVIVLDARSSGAGTIPTPNRSGKTSDGSTVVIIQNDSPERLKIVFSGPDSRIEELASCSFCKTYSLIEPSFCPEQGPIGKYILPPGRYDVVVQSVTDSGVTPWTGNWNLVDGDEYYSCFFITEVKP